MNPEKVATDARERVAWNIRRIAKKRGMSLSRLADFAGVSRPHLERVVNLHADATVGWLAQVAAALGTDITDLVEQAPERTTSPRRPVTPPVKVPLKKAKGKRAPGGRPRPPG